MRKIVNLLIIISVIMIAFSILQTKNFNGINLGQTEGSSSKFSRDKKETYNGEDSYKIESENYSDAMYFKTIETQKNSVYKVSCMVKTENIESETGDFGGFNICLKGKTNKSPSISGTNEWTKINFYFNSYNNTSVDVGFRLGENTGDCKGTVWIADLKIEKGINKKSNNWNFAVFIINKTKIKIKNQILEEQMSSSQKNSIIRCVKNFKSTCESFSNNRMDIEYEIFDLDNTITSLTMDKNAGYCLAPKDVYNIINKYVYEKDKKFDHIFVVANIGDSISNDQIEWLGLGGTVYDNIGYSNIRISGDTIKSYHMGSSNSFPEEVFLHEFLHTLEHNMKDLGYENTIALHDYDKYNYKNKSREGLKQWYYDYMNCNISSDKVSLTDEVYNTQPVTEENFRNSYEIENAFYNDRSIIETISEKISKIF